MPVLDAQLLFASALALPNNTTLQSTNLVDLAATPKMFGTTNPMLLYFFWTGTPVGTSVRIDLRSSASSTDLTSSPTIHWSTGIIPQASYAAAGIGSGLAPTVIYMPNGTYNPGIQSTGGVYKRYLGLYITTVGDATAGIVTSGLAQAIDMRTYNASGYTSPAIAPAIG